MSQRTHAAPDHAHPVEDHDLGLSHDLPRLVQRHRTADGLGRRGLFTLFGGVGAAAVVAGCGTDSSSSAVYAWHADREGRYSMYDEEIVDENYLRGVQETDAQGFVEFTSIYPACYDGRWPHVHFEVYESLAAATSGGDKLRTSQLAFPQDVCETAYAEDGYEDSVTNLATVSLSSDMVFGDGYSLQMATMTGSVADGYVATLNVPV